MAELVTSGIAIGWPRVAGRCPSCGSSSLFVGSGGHVTCSILQCKDPCSAGRLLSGEPSSTDAAPASSESEERHGCEYCTEGTHVTCDSCGAPATGGGKCQECDGWICEMEAYERLWQSDLTDPASVPSREETER